MSESALVMSRPIVCARLRPIIEEDYRQANVVKAAPHVCVHFKKDGQTIKILQDDLTQKLFRLDYTFDVSATQTEVYNTVVRPIVQDVLRGCNGTVLAYGPTAAGKSYTIFGSETKLGVTQFAINDIFDRIQQYEESERVAKVYVTFYQIYMDQIYDLLRVDEELEPLTLREQDGKPLIENLHQLFVKDRDTALEVVRQGLLNRRSYSTNFNMRSSRSHAILQFHIDLEDDEPDNDYDRTLGAGSLHHQQHQQQQHRAHEEEKRSSSSSDAKTHSKLRDTSDSTATATYHVRRRTMTFVDLAGSERLSPHKPASKLVVAETTSINKSIAELSHCLHVMANGGDAASQSGQSHIPLRNSKLTRILIPALSSTSPSLQRSGSTQRTGTHTQRYTTRSLIIANVNPCAYALDETLSTMKFATRVKQIRNLSRSSSPSKALTTPTPITVHAAERLSMFSSAATDHHHHPLHPDDHEDALAATTISSHPTAPRMPALTLMSPHGTTATTSATAGHISPLTTTSTAPHHMHHSYGSPTMTPAMDTEALRSSSIAVDAATTPTPPPSNAHPAAPPSFNLREFLRACTIANRLAQTQQFLAQQEAAAAAQREKLQQLQQQQRASRPDETTGDDEDAAGRGQRLFMSGAATPPPPPPPSQAPASTFNSFPSPAFTIKSLDSDALRLIHSRDSHDAAENETSPMPSSQQSSKKKKQLESRGMVAIKPALSLTVDENDANDDDSDDDSFAGGHRTFEAGLRGTLGADSTPLLAHDVADVSPGLLPGLDKHLSLLSPSASGSFFFADASASAAAGGGGGASGGNARAANGNNAAAALPRPSTMAARRPPPLQQPLSRTSSMRSVESFRLMQGSEYHAFKQHQQQQQQQQHQQAQGQSQTSPEHLAAAVVVAEESPAGPPTPSAATAAAARARLERQAAKNSQQSTPVTAPASASSTPSAQQRYAQLRQQQSAFTFDVPDTATTTAGTNSDSTAATTTTVTSPTAATATTAMNTSPPPRRTPTMQQFTQKLAQQTAQSVLALPADALPATPGGGTVATTAAGVSPHPAGSYQSIRRVIRRVEMTTQTDPPPAVHDKSIQTLSGLHPVAAPMKKLYLGQLDDFDEFVPAPAVDEMTQTEAIFLVSDYYGSVDEQRELTNLALLDPLEVACCFLELKKVVETQAEQIARLQELILNGDR